MDVYVFIDHRNERYPFYISFNIRVGFYLLFSLIRKPKWFVIIRETGEFWTSNILFIFECTSQYESNSITKINYLLPEKELFLIAWIRYPQGVGKQKNNVSKENYSYFKLSLKLNTRSNKCSQGVRNLCSIKYFKVKISHQETFRIWYYKNQISYTSIS